MVLPLHAPPWNHRTDAMDEFLSGDSGLKFPSDINPIALIFR